MHTCATIATRVSATTPTKHSAPSPTKRSDTAPTKISAPHFPTSLLPPLPKSHFHSFQSLCYRPYQNLSSTSSIVSDAAPTKISSTPTKISLPPLPKSLLPPLPKCLFHSYQNLSSTPSKVSATTPTLISLPPLPKSLFYPYPNLSSTPSKVSASALTKISLPSLPKSLFHPSKLSATTLTPWDTLLSIRAYVFWLFMQSLIYVSLCFGLVARLSMRVYFGLSFIYLCVCVFFFACQ